MTERIQRCFLFFGGDSWPGDRYIQDALRERLTRPGDRFICQDDIPEAAHNQSIDKRAAGAWRFADQLDVEELILIGRSSGGRIASLIAPKLRQRTGIVALGYPFRHPHQPPEPIRYQHLASLRVPMVIIQGDRDEYGPGDPHSHFELSCSIETLVVAGPHALNLHEEGWNNVAEFVTRCIGRWTSQADELAAEG